MKKWRSRFAKFGAFSALSFAGLAGFAYFGGLPTSLSSANGNANTIALLDRFGKPLDPISTRLLQEANPKSDRRVPLLSSRASKLAAATIAAEDQRFRSHPGVDLIAVGRAALADARAGSMVEGGSTLTQQLVKLRMGRTGRNVGFTAKAREAIYAVRLDRRLGKRAILSAFLAEAPYGGRVVGADDASRSYFDTTVSQLSWAQAAYLAALPQRPTRFNPLRDPKAAIARQRWVLDRLRSEGRITKREYEVAIREPIAVQLKSRGQTVAPHASEMIRSDKKWQVGVAKNGRVSVLQTTLDLDLQKKLAGIARRRRETLAKNAVSNVAVVVIDNHTGAIRAWEGSGGYGDVENGGMINGPLQRRQTGSTIKPFVYGLAFDAGRNPGDTIDDSPFVRPGLNDDFRPQNYDHGFHGTISLRSALARSINVPAVKLLADAGPQALLDLLNRAGVSIDGGVARHGLSLALGTGEMSLLDLTRAYASIARGGRPVEATMSESVSEARGAAGSRGVDGVDGDLADFGDPVDNSDGSAGSADGARSEPVMSPGAAFLVADVLSDNVARTPAFGRNSVLVFPFPVAAKTGTSQNFRDNWVVGFTHDFTVGVWVGNFDRTSLRDATGVTGAGPLFHDVVLAAHQALTPAAGMYRPESVVPQPNSIDRVCGEPCDGTRTDYRWVGKDDSGNVVSSANPVNPAQTAAKSSALGLVEPRARAIYLIDPTIPSNDQQVRFRASGGTGPYRFTIRTLDGSASEQPATRWTLTPGRFEVCVTDSLDTRSCSAIIVR
jgi:penicillin-binding protein 1C